VQEPATPIAHEPPLRRYATSVPLRDFAGRVALAVAICVLIVGLTVLVAFSIHVWFAAFGAVLMAILIRSISDWLAGLAHIGKKWSVGVVLVAMLGLLVLLVWWSAGPVTREVAELQDRLPKAVGTLQQRLSGMGLDGAFKTSLANPAALLSKANTVMSGALGAFVGTFQSLITVLVILFMSIYLAFSPPTYVSGVVSLFPPSKRGRVRRLLDETALHLRHWIFGQLVSMIAVGIMISVGLYISGVPVPIVLGILAGLLDVIPIFGPVIAAVPAMLLGFSVSPWHALYVVITFVVANQLEQHVLVPIVQRYSLSLPPALTVFALFLLGSLFGFWGMLLGVPITAVALIITKRVYIRDVLKDHSGSEPPSSSGKGQH
jgi:predicted PurR-regulated permease PerM